MSTPSLPVLHGTDPVGEVLAVAERLVVSPARGRFVPCEWVTAEDAAGSLVRAGECLGRVGDLAVRSSFSGQLMGLLAPPGERVSPGQPVAWLRT